MTSGNDAHLPEHPTLSAGTKDPRAWHPRVHHTEHPTLSAGTKDTATARIGLNVSPELHKRLRLMAAEQGTTITAIILAALDAYLKGR